MSFDVSPVRYSDSDSDSDNTTPSKIVSLSMRKTFALLYVDTFYNVQWINEGPNQIWVFAIRIIMPEDTSLHGATHLISENQILMSTAYTL